MSALEYFPLTTINSHRRWLETAIEEDNENVAVGHYSALRYIYVNGTNRSSAAALQALNRFDRVMIERGWWTD